MGTHWFVAAALWSRLALVSAVLLLDAGAPPRRIGAGDLVTRPLAVHETHAYWSRFTKGQSIRVVVDQRDLDARVTVTPPTGEAVVRDGFEHGRETASVVAATTAWHQITITRSDERRAAGNYVLRIEAAAAAGGANQAQVEAERLSTEAKRLRGEGSAEALRRAVQKNQAAAQAWRAAGDRFGEVISLIKLGECYHALSRFAEAHDTFAKAQAAGGDDLGWRVAGEIQNGLGVSAWRLGETAQASAHLRSAVEIWRRHGFDYGRAAAQSNLGILSRQVGEWQAAVTLYLDALATVRSLGDRSAEVFVLNNLGVAHESLAQYDKALDRLQTALALAREQKVTSMEGPLLSVIGRIHLRLGALDRARDAEHAALASTEARGDRRTQAEVLHHLGEIAAKAGDRELARQQYERALAITTGDRRWQAKTVYNLAALDLEAGRTADAARGFARTLALAGAVHDPELHTAATFALARMARDAGDLEHARSRIEQALAAVEDLRTKIAGQRERTAYFASKVELYTFYVDLLMRQHARDGSKHLDRLAFAAAERARARALVESLGDVGDALRRAADPGLAARAQELQRRVNYQWELVAQLSSRQTAVAVEQEAATALDRLLAEYEEVENQIEARSPRYASIVHPQALALSDVQKMLDGNTLLLEYAAGEPRSYLWAVTATGARSYVLPSRSVLETAAAELLRSVSTRPSLASDSGPHWQPAAARLSELLLGPVRPLLENRTLVIVADGGLQHVPFAALPEATGDPLMLNHAISFLPASSLLPPLRHRLATRTIPDRWLSVVADPVMSARDSRVVDPDPHAAKPAVDLARLPSAGEEAEGIVQGIPAGQQVKLTGFAATKRAVLDGSLVRSRILHLSTHALVDRDRPEMSALVLSLVDERGRPQDGFLHAAEIYNLDLPVDLVNLAACETGGGKDIAGEGIIGLVRAFQVAGAARVAYTLWSVDDEAHSRLMLAMYDAMLRRRLPAAAALQAAQRTLWNDPRWKQSPYFWAGVTVQGEWR